MHANGVVINFVRGQNISEGSKYFKKKWTGGPLFWGVQIYHYKPKQNSLNKSEMGKIPRRAENKPTPS